MKSLHLLVLFFVFTLSACKLSGQPAQNQIDTQQMIKDLKVISSDEMAGRRTGSEGNRKAKEYILKRFEEVGAETFQGAFEHEFTFQNRKGESVTGINIIGQIKGDIDSILVISAHYDHLGIRNEMIYNGADDNASGTAALIAIMDYFSRVKPHHTLIFASFDAEEMSLQGAKAFVKDSVLLEKVVLNINMDMIGYNTDGELYASGTFHYPDLKPILENIETGNINLLFGHDRPEDGKQDWTSASDHGAFHYAGKKFIYFGVADHEYYHRETDEFNIIPLDFYKQAVQVVLNAILAFDEKL